MQLNIVLGPIEPEKLDDQIIIRISKAEKEAFYAVTGKSAASVLRQLVVQVTEQLSKPKSER